MNPIVELLENLHDLAVPQETAETIYQICKSAGLDDDGALMIATLIGDLANKTLEIKDLPGEVESMTGLDKTASTNLAAKLTQTLSLTETPSGQAIKILPLRPLFAKEDSLRMIRTKEEKSADEKPLTENTFKTAAPPPQPKPTLPPEPESYILAKPLETRPEPTSPTPPPQPPTSITTPPPPPITPPQAAPQQSQTVSEPTTPIPTTQKEPVFQQSEDAPFILHEETEVKPNQENPNIYSTQRPTFYKPVISEEYKNTFLGDKTARIELGDDEPVKRAPETYKAAGGQPRVVHYSEFRTEVDPFGGVNEGLPQAPPRIVGQPNPPTPTPPPPSQPPAPQKPSEIHPSNIIDLKDLPLK